MNTKQKISELMYSNIEKIIPENMLDEQKSRIIFDLDEIFIARCDKKVVEFPGTNSNSFKFRFKLWTFRERKVMR